jgi:hypothetical protein
MLGRSGDVVNVARVNFVVGVGEKHCGDWWRAEELHSASTAHSYVAA